MEGGVPTSALEGEENAVLTSRQMALTKAASPRFTTPDQTHYDVAVPTIDLDMHTLVYFSLLVLQCSIPPSTLVKVKTLQK